MNKPSSAKLDPDSFHWQFLLPQYWLLWLWFALLWLITRLHMPLVMAIGSGIGWLTYKVAGSRAKTGRRNLELCFPEKSPQAREQILVDCFKCCGHALLFSGIVWWSSLARLQRLVRVEGVDEVLQAHQNGDRIIVVLPHNTCVELCAAALAKYVRLNVLFRVHNNPCWEYVARSGRNRHNVTLIPRKQVGQWIDILHNEGLVGLAPDQDLGPRRSVFVPFFGIPTATVPTVSDIAREHNARVVFVDLYMDENRQFVAACKGFVDQVPSDDRVADTALLNQLLEDSVREHPEQYLWLHRRFKTRPEGEPSLYNKASIAN